MFSRCNGGPNENRLLFWVSCVSCRTLCGILPRLTSTTAAAAIAEHDVFCNQRRVSLLKINVMAFGQERAHAVFPSGGSTLIAMVQTANLREGNDIAGRGRLYGTRPRAVLAERKMRSGVMMVLKIAR